MAGHSMQGADPARAIDRAWWIGGAPDAGKSTVAELLAARHGLQVYHYDSTDAEHHLRLAEGDPGYLAFLNASLDARWVEKEPRELFERSLASFRDRWPLVVEDLRRFAEGGVVAEGFGLTPGLLVEAGAATNQCVFLVPTNEFKAASVAARDKPAWRHETRDPERARRNLLARDELLAAWILESARNFRLPVLSVDVGGTPAQLANAVGEAIGLA